MCEKSFLQKCKRSVKPRTLLPSSRRNANKFNNWAAFPARWLFLPYPYPYPYIYLNTWHLGVPKFSFKRVRVLEIHPTQPRGGHPSHSNLVRGKLTSPTPNPAGDGTSGLTSYPRRRSKVSEATCLRPQRSAPSRTWTRAVQPRVQRSDHWATHASRTQVFGIDDLPCFLVTPSDNVHLFTNKFKGLPALADKTRIIPLK